MKPTNILDRLQFACVGTYPPRQCGIATFSADLCAAICRELADPDACHVIAMNDVPQGYAYGPPVRFEVRQPRPSDYRRAAEYVNIRGMDLLLVQHEYNIFGGTAGRYLLGLLREARMPIVTTLHTVLESPKPELRQVTAELLQLSDRIVVMARRAVDILEKVYGNVRDKIDVIPHGIPDLPLDAPDRYKDRFGVAGRKVMLTFGLLSPVKGLEYAIRAMPALVQRHPDLVYLILGATHPHVKKLRGERYRRDLQRLAERLGVRDHVLFHDRYVELDELCQYLHAADIYITPYLAKDQIASGTLAYALGAGNAVVSTRYCYAQEMLAEGRGRLVPFRDAAAIAEQVDELLSNDTLRETIRRRAHEFTRSFVWREVGRSYANIFHQLRRQRTVHRHA